MSRKRLRPSLSCNYCKRRKVKCDRGKPCSSCVRYNVANLCEYPEGWETSGLDNSVFHVHSASSPSSSLANQESVISELDLLKSRIRQLENNISRPESGRKQNGQNGQTKEASQTGHHRHSGIANEHTIRESIPHNASPLYDSIVDARKPSDAPTPMQGQTPGQIPITPNFGNQFAQFGPCSPASFASQESQWAQRVQLPPLNWSRNASTVDDSSPVFSHTTETSRSSAGGAPFMNPSLVEPENFLGINPYGSELDTINLNKGYTAVHVKRSSRYVNVGPFSWLSIIQKDQILLSMWTHLHKSKVDTLMFRDQDPEIKDCGDKIAQTPAQGENAQQDAEMTTAFKIFKAAPETDSKFQSMALDRDGVEDLRPYDEINRKYKEINTAVSLTKAAPVVFGVGKMDQELALIDKVKAVLPKQKVCWSLIDRFFEYVYPFAPFVDEKSFREHLTRMLGPQGWEDVPIENPRVENRLDLLRLGMFLIILRLTYLSLFSNRNGVNEYNMHTEDPSPSAQQVKYLLNNPVSMDVVGLAEECLNRCSAQRRANPVVVQCAFMLRIYRMFSPEDGDGSDGLDSTTFQGALYQMAQSCGFNREPDNFDDFPADAPSRSLGRKMWFFLIVMDLDLSINHGIPPSINSKFYDTRLPYYQPGNENLLDVEKEKHILSSFAYFEKYYPTLRRVLDMTLDMRSYVKVKDLTQELLLFEKILQDNYGVLQDYFVPFEDDVYAYPFLKTMKVKNYLNLKRFIMNLSYHLFLYYEQRRNNSLAFFYLRKVLTGFLGEMVPGYFELIANNHINFGETSDMILNPSVQMTIQRSNQMIVAVMCRVNLTIHRMKSSDTHDEYLEWNTHNYRVRFAKLCKLAKQLQKIIEYSTALLSRLSNRYYFAWKISKAHNFLVKLLTAKSFYEAREDVTAPVLEMTEEQIDCLSSVCDKALRNFSKTKILRFAKDIYDEISRDSGLASKTPAERNAEKTHGVGSTGLPEQGGGSSSQYRQSGEGGKDGPNTETAQYSGQNGHRGPPNLAALAPSSSGLAAGLVETLEPASSTDFQFFSDAEVDKIWLQLASVKDNADIIEQTGNQNVVEQYLDMGIFGDTSVGLVQSLPDLQPF